MRTNHHHWPGLWPGLILVSVGGGLLAREFGLLPPHVHLVDFWPLILLFAGVSSLVRARALVGALLALAFVAMGGLLSDAQRLRSVEDRLKGNALTDKTIAAAAA